MQAFLWPRSLPKLMRLGDELPSASSPTFAELELASGTAEKDQRLTIETVGLEELLLNVCSPAKTELRSGTVDIHLGATRPYLPRRKHNPSSTSVALGRGWQNQA